VVSVGIIAIIRLHLAASAEGAQNPAGRNRWRWDVAMLIQMSNVIWVVALLMLPA